LSSFENRGVRCPECEQVFETEKEMLDHYVTHYDNQTSYPSYYRHKCTRCKSELNFVSKQRFEKYANKNFRICPVCSVPYRLILNDNDEILEVKRLKEQVTIEAKIEGSNIIIHEKAMDDISFNRLISIARSLSFVDQESKPSVSSAIVAVLGDPVGAIWMNQSIKMTSEYIERRVRLPFEQIYSNYPYQVEQLFKSIRLGGLLTPYQKICDNCGLCIPRNLVNCPFCSQENNKKSEGKVTDPLAMLKLRLARGEITISQYEDLKRIINEK
jgi:ferredoxin